MPCLQPAIQSHTAASSQLRANLDDSPDILGVTTAQVSREHKRWLVGQVSPAIHTHEGHTTTRHAQNRACRATNSHTHVAAGRCTSCNLVDGGDINIEGGIVLGDTTPDGNDVCQLRSAEIRVRIGGVGWDGDGVPVVVPGSVGIGTAFEVEPAVSTTVAVWWL